MRTNKAILDEAARSVRRTFIGSVAGTVGMFAVVGAAGAYGMPENLAAQALSAAIARFNVRFPRVQPTPQEQQISVIVQPVVAAPVVMAAPVAMAAQPAQAVQPDELMSQTVVAQNRPQVKPITDMPAVEQIELPPEAATAMASVAPVAPMPTIVAKPPVVSPVVTPVAQTVPSPAPPGPAPVITASVAPRALPQRGVQGVFAPVPAPLVFEMAKADAAQVLTELPKTQEIVVAPVAASSTATAKSAASPTQVASLDPAAIELPKSVMLTLPLPKPPLTPAQRLELQGKDYDKAEKCLAQAVYFEARNEPARGQQAVAQVVLNRVFSPYYPKDVCSVVYQNAHRHLACQFTFACDGKPESINERGAWQRANRIAQQTLEAKVWLPEVSKATHYHASYVHPKWVRDMKVMVRYGVHTFYRPRNWGDGHDEPAWGAGAKKPVKS